MQGPQEDAAVAAANERASKDLLDSYWQFVRENPNDFQGWTYLIQHVENIDDLDEVRTAYNAFLPLYPYCFAYWQRYSEIEKKHEKWQRALAILHRGLEAIPLSVDLWVSYLELYKKMYVDNADFADLFRQQCERAVQTVGLEYRSDVLWEQYVEWEVERGDLKWITGILKRVVGIPTKMYNKHWDNFIAHIRDHHPRDILDYDEYEELRKVTCAELEVPYTPGMQFSWLLYLYYYRIPRRARIRGSKRRSRKRSRSRFGRENSQFQTVAGKELSHVKSSSPSTSQNLSY